MVVFFSQLISATLAIILFGVSAFTYFYMYIRLKPYENASSGEDFGKMERIHKADASPLDGERSAERGGGEDG